MLDAGSDLSCAIKHYCCSLPDGFKRNWSGPNARYKDCKRIAEIALTKKTAQEIEDRGISIEANIDLPSLGGDVGLGEGVGGDIDGRARRFLISAR